MDLLWPGFFLLLGLIPLLIAVYIWRLRRRQRFVVRYSSLSLVRDAMPRYAWWRRHLPFVLFLFAFASLAMALMRPVAIVSVPTGQTTIILTMDVSRSMCATDILPNRLESAKAAALSFVQGQSANAQIGLVAFAGFAETIQLPTNDQEILQDAIVSLTTGRRTAIGSAILKSLDTIAEIDPNVAPSVADGSPGVDVLPVPKGAYAPAIIVLLTDGVSNAGPQPVEAAQQAADRGVRVYTIGFGTENESSPFGGPGCQFGDPFGGGFGGPSFGGGGGGGFRRGIDEETLREVSAMTGGEYYAATSAGELQSVFQSLPTSLITRHETTEISVAFAALGALLAALAVGLSQLWSPLP
ncbi:MAG: VWA domain-containing protein [Anaerolineales bacterium]